MKHLYFARHGLSAMNQAGLIAGLNVVSPLLPEGRKQARLAGRQACELQIHHIVSSPIERAHHTAKIIAGEIGYPHQQISVTDLLIERDFGAIEGTPWRPNMDIEGVDGVEPLESLYKRAHETYQLIRDLPGDNVLIVSHGAIGRAIRRVVHTLHPDETLEDHSQFQYAQIVQLL